MSLGYKVHVHDYKAQENTKIKFGCAINYYEDPIDVIRNSDVIYISTIWDKYNEISDEQFIKIKKKNAVVVDCRSMYKNRKNYPWRIRVGLSLSNVTI